MFARVADEVPDDQEVSGELHLLDDADFARQPLFVVRESVLELVLRLQPVQHFRPLRESLPRDVFEIAVQREARRHLEMRKWSLNFLQLHAATFCNVERARQNLRRIFEDHGHFFVTLHKEIGAVELHAVRILDRLARLDAEHHILRVRIFLAEIVAVVGGHHRQAKSFSIR